MLLSIIFLPACQSTEPLSSRRTPTRKTYTPAESPSLSSSASSTGTGKNSRSANQLIDDDATTLASGTGNGSGNGSGSGTGSGNGTGTGSGSSTSNSTTSAAGGGRPGNGFETNLPLPSESEAAFSAQDPGANAWAAAVKPSAPAANTQTTPAKSTPPLPVIEPPKPNIADEIQEKIRGVTIATPKIDVPNTSQPADPQKPGAGLIGAWSQSDHLGSPDFSDGGYTSRTLSFQSSGTLIVSSSFDKDAAIKGARSFQWSISPEGKLVIDRVPGKNNDATNVEFNLGSAAVTPATLKLPATLPWKITDKTLTLDDKTYKKQ